MNLKEERETESIDYDEIIIHPNDYNDKIRKKLMKILKELRVNLKKRITPNKTMGISKEDRERIINIERGCCNMKCNPCTYPNCQRFILERKLIRKCIGGIINA